MDYVKVNDCVNQNDDPSIMFEHSEDVNVSELAKHLLDASRNGDVEMVKHLINLGVMFTTDWLGMTPLHFAAMNGHLSTCKALIDAGVSRDSKTKVERTPLHLAAQEGHEDIVELLLVSGADIHSVDTLKQTALHWAAERGHCPVIQVLMRYGADVNFRNKFGLTPIELAEYRNHLEAKEAMMTTQLEINPSVGKMAAPNEDLADPTAFIITDEATVIPAAPPADEVVITSAYPDEPTKAPQEGRTFSDLDLKPEWFEEARGFARRESNNPSGFPLDALETSESTEVHGISSEDHLLAVETPDGKKLYVRQEETENGFMITIFDSDGLIVSDPDLVREVEAAVADCCYGEEIKTEAEEDHPMIPVNNGSLPTLGAEQEVPMSPENEVHQRILEFATDQNDIGLPLHIRDIPAMNSREELSTWLRVYGLALSSFTSMDSFVISVADGDAEFFLNASYDSELQSIVAYH